MLVHLDEASADALPAARLLATQLGRWDVAVVWLASPRSLARLEPDLTSAYAVPFELGSADDRARHAYLIEEAELTVSLGDDGFTGHARSLGAPVLAVSGEALALAARQPDGLFDDLRRRLEAKRALEPTRRGTLDQVPLPRKATLELFGGCQLRCPLCPTGRRQKPGRPPGAMSLATASSLIEPLAGALREVDLFSWGEPFLNPQACDIIRLLADRGLRTTVSSNLQVMPDPHALLASGLSELIVSCHGLTQETYGRYMVGGQVEKTLANLDRLVAAAGPSSSLRIVLRFVVFAHNEHELPLARRRFEGTKVVVEAAPMRVDMRDEILESAADNLRRYGDWVPPSSRFYDRAQGAVRRPTLGCNLPFEEVVLDVDGAVSFCCSSYDPAFDAGNALGDGFAAVWNGPRYQDARRVVTAREPRDPSVLCRTCKKNGYRDF